MVSTGKLGLGIAGGTLGLGAIEAGRAAYHAPSLVKDFKEVMQLRNNAEARNAIKRGIHEAVKDVPLPGLEKGITKGIKSAEGVYNKTKFSKLDRLQRGLNIVNEASKQSRTVLGNAERWAGMARDRVLDANPELSNSAEVKKIADRGVSAIGRIGKMGLRVKNAKILGKAGLAIGGVSGAAYLHGKELESYKRRNNGGM